MSVRIVSRADERIHGEAVEHRPIGTRLDIAEAFVEAVRPLAHGLPLHVRGRVKTTVVRFGDEWEIPLIGHQWLVRMSEGAYSANDDADIRRLFWVLPEPECTVALHKAYGGDACCYCCDACNYGRHICPACGEAIRHDSTDFSSLGDYQGHPCITPCRTCGVIGHEHPADTGRTASHIYEPVEHTL